MKERHGKSKTRLYKIWQAMRYRCHNKEDARYKWYGARGIEVCKEWRESFLPFYDWAMNNGYEENLTIERKDTNGNYCPDNCCWSTFKEQENNRRNNRMLEYNGKTQTMAKWAEEYNLDYHLFQMRLEKGWSIERALTQSKQIQNRKRA